MTETKINVIIEAALIMAYEAGRWRGQVDLEEFYDRDSYSAAMIESVYARKMNMPMHKPTVNKMELTVKLRSDEWREGVKKSSMEYVETARQWVEKYTEVRDKVSNKSQDDKNMEIDFG